jgi:RNA polymerase sigma-70 factor (ECF subfamily)
MKKTSLKDLGLTFKQTRSEKTFTELYNRIRPGLYNYVFKILKTRDDTENVISYTMSTVYNKIDTYNPTWHISTWIYRIAYTAACMELRKSKARKTVLISKLENSENSNLMSKIEYFANGNYVEEMIIQEDIDQKIQEQNALHNCISKLPSKYREVIEEKFFKDAKYDEIAQKFNIPLHTVKNRISRGKSLLKETIKDLYIN